MSLKSMIDSPTMTIGEIADFLDNASHETRVAEMTSIGKAHQKKLWDLAEAAEPITLAHFVPEGLDPHREVIHHGRNTLPVFNFFQKRFAGFSDDDTRAYGYNEGATRPLIGPGYFVLRSTEGDPTHEARSAMVVDYFLVPPADVTKPDAWPAIKPNSAGLQVLVYNKTRDFMRKVSEHASIGMAFKVEKSLNNWFTLTREDPS